MNYLFLIPARGGSKGIPGKNIKLLGNKPLIQYSLEIARKFTSDDNICISTDDAGIIDVLQQLKYEVPFVRPAGLATDTASSYDVILHALEYYSGKGKSYDGIILLQPTSPFRRVSDVQRAIELFNEQTDLVVTVQRARTNPYYALYKKSTDEYIEKFMDESFTRRQDLPELFEWNGAVYVINAAALDRYDSLVHMKKIKMVEMDELHSLDLDTPTDWLIAEALIEKGVLS